jgi:hypothetical protein
MPKYFQFARCHSYSDKPNEEARKNGHKSARQVIEELKREPHASPHVTNPRQPAVLRGTPTGTYEKAMTIHSLGEDARGHKRRKDAHILAGCIASYPVPVAQVEADPEELRRLGKWIDLTVKWADRYFGKKCIDTIVCHMDETSPHLHIIVLPPAPGIEPCPLRRRQTEARRAYKGQKIQKTMANIAYRDAGTAFQLSFYKEVSIEFDHGLKRPPEEQKRRLKPREQRAKKTFEQGQKLREEYLLQQAREAFQQQLHQSAVEAAERKKELEEKDAEIARLTQLLAIQQAPIVERDRLQSDAPGEANGSQSKPRDEGNPKLPKDSSVKESDRNFSIPSKATRANRKVIDTAQIPLELPSIEAPGIDDSAPQATPFRRAS